MAAAISPYATRVVDEWREEVERAEDREVVGDPVRGGVVGRLQPGDERGIVAAARAEPREGVGEQVRAQLRRATAAVGHLGQADRGELGPDGHRPILGSGRCPAKSRRYHRARERGVPVGPPVFKTGGAAPGVARWVRLPCAPATPLARCDDRRVQPSARPPSVERVLAAVRAETTDRDPAAVLAMARAVVDEERARLAGVATPAAARTPEDLAAELVARLVAARAASPAPSRVINATGVIVHTNLGRAPWPRAAIDAARAAAEGTIFLELDRETGRRGRRFREAEDHLVALTGAEDALVVVNNAAAVALAVGLAGRGGVAVSRGELVEIGGGVRIPEIVRRAGREAGRGGDDEPDAGRRLRGGPRRRPGDGSSCGSIRRTSARPGSSETPDAPALSAARPPPRRARRRRPRQRRAARHGRLRPRARADARGAPRRTVPTS